MAHQPGPKVHARETRPLYRKACYLLIVEAQIQCDGFEARTALAEFLQPRDIVSIDKVQPCKSRQRIVEVVDLLRNEFELVGWQVLGDYTSLAVKDEAANRRHGFDTDAVALRALGKVLVLDDLQLHESSDYQTESDHREYAGQDDACEKQPPFGVVILDGRQQAQSNPRSVRDIACLTGTSTVSAR